MPSDPLCSACPEISVVVPTYRSEATVGRCLAQLEAQTHGSYELIVVDSSPDNACARVVSAFRMARLERSSEPLRPQAARALGSSLARGRLLVFTDPDCYAPPDWLERLAAAAAQHSAVAGGLACQGTHWLDQGIHLCKFSKWLPNRRGRFVDVGPSANLALPRRLFEELGGFSGMLDEMHGDATSSWRLAAAAHPVYLASDAWVAYHHLQSLSGFLRERFQRGRSFARVRQTQCGGGPLSGLGRALVTPLRLVANLAQVARHAFGARQGLILLSTLPVVVLGFASSLAGEMLGSGWSAFHSAKLRGSGDAGPPIPPGR